MWIHDGALNVLCIAGMDEASVLVLERARQFAEVMGARIHIAGVCGVESARALARLTSWVHEVGQLPPSCFTISSLSGSENILPTRLRELVADVHPDLVIAPGVLDAARSFAWLSPNIAWSIASEVGAALLFSRPRIAPAGILALTDFSAGTHHVVELSAMLGRAFDTNVDYVRAEAEVDPSGQDAFTLASDLKSRRSDIVVVGLASGRSRVPSALARDTQSSLLLVPLAQRMLH